MHQDPTPCSFFAQALASCNTALSPEGDNVARCGGAEPSNANISFPEHFEGKRQSGEMYQKDCLPLLSTFCKFQRLKVKGSQVMLVYLLQHSRIGTSTTTERQRCAGCPVIQKLLCGSHIHLYVTVLNFTLGYFGMVSKHPIVSSDSSDSELR